MQFQAKHPQKLFEIIGNEYFSQLLTACGAGADGFRARFLPMAERLALFVQDLPLERETFCDPGGALRFGLQSGLTALRLCDGVIFSPNATSQRRMQVEPQFRWAAWCATLACVPLVVAHNTRVKVKDDVWSFESEKATLWDACDKTGSYEVEWMPQTPAKPSQALGIVYLSRFFFDGQFSGTDPDVLRQMCEAINPALLQSPAETSLARVVRTAQEKVRLSERTRMSQVFSLSTSSKPTDGMPQIETSQPPGGGPVTEGAKANEPLQHAVTPIANFAQPIEVSADPSPKAEPGIPEKILQWARAVGSTSTMHSSLQFLPTGELRISKLALNFGAPARETYNDLFLAGLVVRKGESDAIVKPILAAIFKSAMESRNA